MLFQRPGIVNKWPRKNYVPEWSAEKFARETKNRLKGRKTSARYFRPASLRADVGELP